MVPEYGEGKMWLTFCYLAAISTHLDTSGYILIHQYAQNNMGYRLQPSVNKNVKTLIGIIWSVIL